MTGGDGEAFAGFLGFFGFSGFDPLQLTSNSGFAFLFAFEDLVPIVLQQRSSATTRISSGVSVDLFH